MKPLTLQDVRQAVAGQSLTPLPPGAPPVKAICTDTRDMRPDSLFVALRGDRFDAHEYLAQAAAGGAAAAQSEDALREDTLAALLQLGFPKPSAEKAITNSIQEGGGLSVETLLRRSLRQLSKG